MEVAQPRVLVTRAQGATTTVVAEANLVARLRGRLTFVLETGCAAAVLTTMLTVLLATSARIPSRMAVAVGTEAGIVTTAVVEVAMVVAVGVTTVVAAAEIDLRAENAAEILVLGRALETEEATAVAVAVAMGVLAEASADHNVRVNTYYRRGGSTRVSSLRHGKSSFLFI